jgi:hypothetical protein
LQEGYSHILLLLINKVISSIILGWSLKNNNDNSYPKLFYHDNYSRDLSVKYYL